MLGFTAMLAIAFALIVNPKPATAHSSDFETLTVDLILTSGGLVAIEGAVNLSPGPNYEPYPTDETREATAAAVMRTLGIDVADVSVHSGDSRYHEVGFAVRPPAPLASERNGTLRFDTSALQRIAAERKLKHLKLSVCDADGDTYTTTGVQVVTPNVITAIATSTGRSIAQER